MKCIKCGLENPESNQFCSACGTELNNDQNMSVKKKKGIIPIIIIIVLFLLLLKSCFGGQSIGDKAKAAGVSESTIEETIKIAEKIGVKEDKMTNWAKENDWAQGQSFNFDYNRYVITVFLDKDNKVIKIFSGGIEFYNNGKIISNVNDRLITSSEKIRIEMQTEKDIRLVLKAPSTAKFDDMSINKDGDEYVVIGKVDSENSFGAMIRSSFRIDYEWDGEDDSEIKAKSLMFDGEFIY